MKTLEIQIHEPARCNAKFFYVYSIMCQNKDQIQFEYRSFLSKEIAEEQCKLLRNWFKNENIYWVHRIQVFVR